LENELPMEYNEQPSIISNEIDSSFFEFLSDSSIFTYTFTSFHSNEFLLHQLNPSHIILYDVHLSLIRYLEVRGIVSQLFLNRGFSM
jgi:hypothetical protein